MVLVILIVLTGVQAIQLYDLKVVISGGSPIFGTTLKTIVPKGGSVPSSLDSLPPMIGGC